MSRNGAHVLFYVSLPHLPSKNPFSAYLKGATSREDFPDLYVERTINNAVRPGTGRRP